GVAIKQTVAGLNEISPQLNSAAGAGRAINQGYVIRRGIQTKDGAKVGTAAKLGDAIEQAIAQLKQAADRTGVRADGYQARNLAVTLAIKTHAVNTANTKVTPGARRSENKAAADGCRGGVGRPAVTAAGRKAFHDCQARAIISITSELRGAKEQPIGGFDKRAGRSFGCIQSGKLRVTATVLADAEHR